MDSYVPPIAYFQLLKLIAHLVEKRINCETVPKPKLPKLLTFMAQMKPSQKRDPQYAKPNTSSRRRWSQTIREKVV